MVSRPGGSNGCHHGYAAAVPGGHSVQCSISGSSAQGMQGSSDFPLAAPAYRFERICNPGTPGTQKNNCPSGIRTWLVPFLSSEGEPGLLDPGAGARIWDP